MKHRTETKSNLLKILTQSKRAEPSPTLTYKRLLTSKRPTLSRASTRTTTTNTNSNKTTNPTSDNRSKSKFAKRRNLILLISTKIAAGSFSLRELRMLQSIKDCMKLRFKSKKCRTDLKIILFICRILLAWTRRKKGEKANFRSHFRTRRIMGLIFMKKGFSLLK